MANLIKNQMPKESHEMLHITNGDGAGGILEASSIEGAVLPWRDPMHHGPFPADHTLDALRPIRAKYLAGSTLSQALVEQDFAFRDAQLQSLVSGAQVVLWFEHDLLDQLQLLQILDWFALYAPCDIAVELICVGCFPGIDPFRGLGQLNPSQMASLFDQRIPVSAEMLDLAAAGWAAFRADDPNELLRFLKRDLSSLPFLRDALMRHFQEYPSTQTGLTRSERQMIELVGQGVNGPVDLFLRNMDLETALFLGDMRSYSILNDLSQAGVIICETEAFQMPTTADQDARFQDQKLVLSDMGRQLLNGKIDPTASVQRDVWLGGVRVNTAAPHWTWDDVAQTLVLRQPFRRQQ